MIKTNYCGGEHEPWLAVDMDAAARLLDGYNLTVGERTELHVLMAGYCRLLDEAGFLHYGATEENAIRLAKAHGGDPMSAPRAARLHHRHISEREPRP